MGSHLHDTEYSGHFQSGNNQWVGNRFNGDVHFNSSAPSNYDIDRFCLRALRCADSFAVKNRLKENKDKLIHRSFDWILRDAQYTSWQDGTDVGLLWIKGGAGKGKTMMSIGLIEELCQRPKEITAVTYFFCQDADYELNTIEAIVKGLIFQLLKQQESLKQSLRDRWDTVHNRFSDDVSSWRGLWNIFMEMLHNCQHERVYVVVDALDECRADGMADLLKLIVRTGLGRPSQVKWLLTSRPLDSAERELLVGSDQVQVSLELNAQHISKGVRTYISDKVAELDRRCGYGSVLRQQIEQELSQKAEDTFLWVGLVCKRLETVRREEALTAIQELPPGLNGLYCRAYTNLCDGESSLVEGCIRLLTVMMLAYRPLKVHELSSVADLSDDEQWIKTLIGRCASFVKTRGIYVEFIHQSARDYLAGQSGPSPVDAGNQSGHAEIAMHSLAHLSRRLKANLLDFSWLAATRETMVEGKHELLTSLDYAATFWFQHLEVAKDTMTVHQALTENGEVQRFLCTWVLEWLECLSVLNQLPRAVAALQTLTKLSAKTEDTLTGHSGLVEAVAFSPDGRRIVSGSDDGTIKVWDATTGQVETTLTGHSSSVTAVTFSPDGRRIASGSGDGTIKVWDATTGQVETTLTGHSGLVEAVTFSPDGRRIASGSGDKTIKVWDATTGQVETTLTGHSGLVRAVTFSPDGRRIASGSGDETIKVWDLTQFSQKPKWHKKIFHKHQNFKALRTIKTSEPVFKIRFSADGIHLESDRGIFKAIQMAAGKHTSAEEASYGLYVSDQWIYYGTWPLLCLPPDYEASDYDTKGDQIAIGFQNGRVLTFTIDCKKLLLKVND